ncbi:MULTISPECIES: cupin domain-containing protein [Acidiplasma]|jgi:quercetin dioxygenase-like cupin family protein|uniref:Cupin n=1 Tax=Acidiplasma cupricumulans TaxID=312540 RepID=A0A0Q0REL1_9ARCH|nr:MULTISPECIES: cupin domain-containing protein [Acidiplasma]KJE49813.1 cupin [Acidiplasma sp. MBA-1]KQB33518.1 cupin [Acidiplasma cupricumulans]WMT54972.1 MAG: cupin domain-containing protein [Acidiplasma sp.]
MTELTKFTWDGVKKENLTDLLSRQMIYGDKVMIARLEIKKGAVVPEHSHENEQMTWIMKGALKFRINGSEITVGEGEILRIPSNVKHEAVAIEDTLDIDIFSPIRTDWITGDDAYLRNKK